MPTQYTGVSPGSLPDPSAPDFTPRLRAMLSSIDIWARDASLGMGRIVGSQVPSGSGDPIGIPVTSLVTAHGDLTGLGDDDHTQYLLLGGRTGGQTVASIDNTDPTLTVSGGSNENTDVQRWTDSGASVFGAIVVRTGGTERVALYTDLNSTGLSLLVGDFATGVGLDITPAVLRLVQVVGCRLDWSTTSPALVGVDAAAASAAVVDGDDNIRIIRRSATQTGRSIAFYEQTRATELFLVRADGHHYSTPGASNLTGQTGSIGATTLLTGAASDTAGMYRVSVYVKTTTAGNALDAVAVTLAWNDGTAQTNVVVTAHDLATLNAYSQASAVLYLAASVNISYTTTVAITGSPAYTIRVRTEALG